MSSTSALSYALHECDRFCLLRAVATSIMCTIHCVTVCRTDFFLRGSRFCTSVGGEQASIQLLTQVHMFAVVAIRLSSKQSSAFFKCRHGRHCRCCWPVAQPTPPAPTKKIRQGCHLPSPKPENELKHPNAHPLTSAPTRPHTANEPPSFTGAVLPPSSPP